MYHDPLDITKLTQAPRCKKLGTRWVIEKELASTNDLARDLIRKGAPEGTIVIADRQTHGKGRHGRAWESPPQAGVYLSVILNPPGPMENAPFLTLVTGVAVVEALTSFCSPTLKWPNDLLIKGKKVSGILCEYCPENEHPAGAIVGVGINVHQMASEFPSPLDTIATSIFAETGQRVPRTRIILQLIKALDEEYDRFLKRGPLETISRWSERTGMFGKTVSLTQGSKTVTGIAKKLDSEGRLVLETESGEVAFSAGEVTIIKQ